MFAQYPQPDTALLDPEAEQAIDQLRDIIVGIRNIRAEYKVEPAKLVSATVVSAQHELLDGQRALLARLARINIDELTFVPALRERPKAAATVVIGAVEIFVPLAGMIDLDAERQRLTKELDNAQQDAERRRTRLADSSFVDKAPANIVQRERDNLAAADAQIERLRQRLLDYSA
jgi:valyl-tRNA synthetase